MRKTISGRYLSWTLILTLVLSLFAMHGGAYAEDGVKFRFRDDFGSFDDTFWTVRDKYGTAMDMVDVNNGVLTLSATETDNYPTLISKGIPISMGDKLIIKRRTYAHPDHDKFAPGAYVTEETDDSWNTDSNRDNHILLFFQHLYFTYDVGRYPENLTKGNFGYSRMDDFTKPSELASENYGITRSTLDEWVEEEFVYDTVTGDVIITSGGETMSFKGRPLEYSYVRFHMSPYGWNTGQFDQMDWIEFEVVGPNAEDLIEDNSGAGLNDSITQTFQKRDDFDGNSLNSDFWYVYDKGGQAYDRVTVSGGEMTLPCDRTDNPPILMSKGISVQKGDIFTIKRRTYAHAANDTYRPWALVQEVNTDGYTTNAEDSTNLFSFQHLNFTYDPGRYPGAVTQANLGLYAQPGQNIAQLPQSQYGVTPLTLDRWVEEEFVYDTESGQVTITSDGNTMTFTSKALEKPYIRFLMNPYGWNTGHYDKMDWIEFSVQRAGQVGGNIPDSSSGIIKGVVYDFDSETPMTGVTIELQKNGSVIDSRTSDSIGEYSFTAMPGQYDLVFKKSGYIGATYSDIESVGGETTYVEMIFQVPQSAENGEAQGQILNALTGQPEPNVRVEIRQGLNNKTGTALQVLTTDANGNYTFSAASGYYTMTATKDGFANKTFSAPLRGGADITIPDAAISPNLQADQFRVVLRWGNTPYDLDSHLIGPGSGGEVSHVYYGNKSYSSAQFMVLLDVDDQDGEGPETITVTKPMDGTFTYSVHDFTNKGLTNSTELANSMATVEVYIGNNPPKVFNVPNQPGTLWKVFTYDGTSVRAVNTMTYVSDQESIR